MAEFLSIYGDIINISVQFTNKQTHCPDSP